MRLLAMTNLYPNPIQPQRAPFNRHHLRILAQTHPVRVIAPIAWTEEWECRKKRTSIFPGRRMVSRDGLTVDHPRYWFPPKILRQYYGHFYWASVKRTFRRAVAEFKPDLIFSPWAYPDGWAATRLAREAKCPVVIQVHGSDVLLLDQFPARKARTAHALRSADGVIAVSNDITENLVRLGVARDRIRMIHDGVDYNVFHPGSKDEARQRLQIAAGNPQLLFIGNLVPVKAVDVLLAAVSLLKRSGLPVRLVIIGQGPLRASLELLTARLGIIDQVLFAGAMPQDQLPAWYRAADLFVLPSHSEGVPNVLLEASACGTPFVASRVGGIPEIAHLGRGLLVPPNNPTQLTDAIRKQLTCPVMTDPVLPRDRREAVADVGDFLNSVLKSFRNAAENNRSLLETL